MSETNLTPQHLEEKLLALLDAHAAQARASYASTLETAAEWPELNFLEDEPIHSGLQLIEEAFPDDKSPFPARPTKVLAMGMLVGLAVAHGVYLGRSASVSTFGLNPESLLSAILSK